MIEALHQIILDQTGERVVGCSGITWHPGHIILRDPHIERVVRQRRNIHNLLAESAGPTPGFCLVPGIEIGVDEKIKLQQAVALGFVAFQQVAALEGGDKPESHRKQGDQGGDKLTRGRQ